MFLNTHNYNISFSDLDISLHDNVPKQFYHLKNKKFGDWEIAPWELLIFKQRLLGEGSFAKVYLAKWRETFVVAKVINEQICKNEKELVLREFEIMTKLHHPNIVQFLGYIDEPLIIVMEYIPNKNLLENIEAHNLNKSQKKTIMRDILQGLAYIHNRRPYSLIHRDIKPTNILITNSKVAKITDFGLSKFYNLHKVHSYSNLESLDSLFKDESNKDESNKDEIKNNQETINDPLLKNELTSHVGTERYMAPEANNSVNYDNKIDIYSSGILFYEMFENKRYILNNGFNWYHTPKKIKDVILESMLCSDPKDRLDAQSLIKRFDNI